MDNMYGHLYQSISDALNADHPTEENITPNEVIDKPMEVVDTPIEVKEQPENLIIVERQETKEKYSCSNRLHNHLETLLSHISEQKQVILVCASFPGLKVTDKVQSRFPLLITNSFSTAEQYKEYSPELEILVLTEDWQTYEKAENTKVSNEKEEVKQSVITSPKAPAIITPSSTPTPSPFASNKTYNNFSVYTPTHKGGHVAAMLEAMKKPNEQDPYTYIFMEGREYQGNIPHKAGFNIFSPEDLASAKEETEERMLLDPEFWIGDLIQFAREGQILFLCTWWMSNKKAQQYGYSSIHDPDMPNYLNVIIDKINSLV